MEKVTLTHEPMKCLAVFFLSFLAAASVLHAENGEFEGEPNPVARILQAITTTKDERLTPKTYTEDGSEYSYRLISARYLGAITLEGRTFRLGTIFFIRSSPKGGDLPPGRGHGFLLCLSSDYQLISSCKLDFPDEVNLVEKKLLRVKEEIANFSITAASVKSEGFLIDGHYFLSYPSPALQKSGK